MVVYEKDRSQSVVSRLSILATTLNWIAITFWALILASLMAITVAYFDPDYWWLGAVFGILLGYGFGIHISSVLHLVFEWMAQMLIIQSEILDRMKNNT